MSNFIVSLEIMAKGMAGIFVAIILIMIVVAIMGKFSSPSKKTDEDEI